jgi:hypothetical protein
LNYFVGLKINIYKFNVIKIATKIIAKFKI